MDDHTPVYVGLPFFHLVCRPLENMLDDIPGGLHGTVHEGLAVPSFDQIQGWTEPQCRIPWRAAELWGAGDRLQLDTGCLSESGSTEAPYAWNTHKLGFWNWAWGQRPWMSLTLTKYPQRVDAVKILGIAFTTPRNVPLHLFGRRLACERANKWLEDIRRRFNLFERGVDFVIFNFLHSCAKWLSGPSHCQMKQDNFS